MNARAASRGIALILVSGILVLLAVASTAMLNLAGQTRFQAAHSTDQASARLLARSGLSYATARLFQDPVPRTPPSPENQADDWTCRDSPTVPIENALNPSYAQTEPYYDLTKDGVFDGVDTYTDLNGNGRFDSWSGRLRNRHGTTSGAFALKIVAADGGIDVNQGCLDGGDRNGNGIPDSADRGRGWNDPKTVEGDRFLQPRNGRLADVLNSLGAAVGADRLDVGDWLLAHRPAGGFSSRGQLAGVLAGDWPRLSPFLSLSATEWREYPAGSIISVAGAETVAGSYQGEESSRLARAGIVPGSLALKQVSPVPRNFVLGVDYALDARAGTVAWIQPPSIGGRVQASYWYYGVSRRPLVSLPSASPAVIQALLSGVGRPDSNFLAAVRPSDLTLSAGDAALLSQEFSRGAQTGSWYRFSTWLYRTGKALLDAPLADGSNWDGLGSSPGVYSRWDVLFPHVEGNLAPEILDTPFIGCWWPGGQRMVGLSGEGATCGPVSWWGYDDEVPLRRGKMELVPVAAILYGGVGPAGAYRTTGKPAGLWPYGTQEVTLDSAGSFSIESLGRVAEGNGPRFSAQASGSTELGPLFGTVVADSQADFEGLPGARPRKDRMQTWPDFPVDSRPDAPGLSYPWDRGTLRLMDRSDGPLGGGAGGEVAYFPCWEGGQPLREPPMPASTDETFGDFSASRGRVTAVRATDAARPAGGGASVAWSEHLLAVDGSVSSGTIEMVTTGFGPLYNDLFAPLGSFKSTNVWWDHWAPRDRGNCVLWYYGSQDGSAPEERGIACGLCYQVLTGMLYGTVNEALTEATLPDVRAFWSDYRAQYQWNGPPPSPVPLPNTVASGYVREDSTTQYLSIRSFPSHELDHYRLTYTFAPGTMQGYINGIPDPGLTGEYAPGAVNPAVSDPGMHLDYLRADEMRFHTVPKDPAAILARSLAPRFWAPDPAGAGVNDPALAARLATVPSFLSPIHRFPKPVTLIGARWDGYVPAKIREAFTLSPPPGGGAAPIRVELWCYSGTGENEQPKVVVLPEEFWSQGGGRKELDLPGVRAFRYRVEMNAGDPGGYNDQTPILDSIEVAYR